MGDSAEAAAAEAVEEVDDDVPELDDDEFAQVDPDQIEAEAGAGADDQEDDVDDSADDSASSETTSSSTPAIPDGDSLGDQYVNTLCALSNGIVDEYGKEGAESVDEEMARQLGLDTHFDRLMAEKGHTEMDPAKAVVVFTVVFLLIQIGTKTTLFQDAMEDFEL